jgi:hypothetical protein
MKCAESTCRLTNIGEVDNPIHDEPDVFFWVCQSSSHISGFSQINEVPGKKMKGFLREYPISMIYFMEKFVVCHHVFFGYSKSK